MLTILAVVILLQHMPTVSYMADVARLADSAALDDLGGDLLHPGIGLGLLLVIQVLNVFKLRSVTRYGRRKQSERQAAPPRTTALVDPLRTQG